MNSKNVSNICIGYFTTNVYAFQTIFLSNHHVYLIIQSISIHIYNYTMFRINQGSSGYGKGFLKAIIDKILIG
jgi:hypothetical protein